MSGVLAGKTITQIATGFYHSLVLTSDGSVYIWGNGGSGQLGNGATADSLVPGAIDTTGVLAGKTITQIAASDYGSLALTSDGLVYTWGYGTGGQLGNGTAADSLTPVAVDTTGVLAGKTITHITAGSEHSLALTSDGSLYAWGPNWSGQLGNGTITNSSVPVAVDTTGVLAGKTIVQASAGYGHSLVLTSDGSVYAWGTNGFGGLGNGTAVDSLIPVAVDTTGTLAGKTVTQVAAGFYHSLALTSDGSLYAWGPNWFGQLGDGTTDGSLVPVAVSPLPYPALTGITFDGIPVTSFEILPNGNVSMVAPAHTAGPVDIVFTYADGRTTTIQNGFTYEDAATGGGTIDSTTPTTPDTPVVLETPAAPDSGVTQQGSVVFAILITAASVLLAGVGGVISYRTSRSR